MIDIKTFNRLKNFHTSSWAVWDEDEKNDIDFFHSKLHMFHGKAIFVGLNRSGIANNKSKVFPLSNFHTKKHTGDKRLKRFIQDNHLTYLIGGFMSDISDQIESNSNLVEFEANKAIEHFIEKVHLIDSSITRHLVCFGDKVFNTFVNNFGIQNKQIQINSENKIKQTKIKVENEEWYFYRVWHYSNYGRFIHKSEKELPIQLKYINDKIALQL